MKKFVSLFLALLMALSLVACGGGGGDTTDDGSTPDDGGSASTGEDLDTLKVIQGFDPGTFEPGNNDEQGYNRIVRQIYETLFFFDENGELQPWLATGYTWDDDTHMRVTLREGVKFSDGTDFTAEDVIWTFTRAIEDALPNSHYNMIDPAGCEVVDDLTCVIALKYPCSTLPNHLANSQCVIASKAAYEANDGDYLGGAVVGTGPYKLVSYTPGDMIIFEANEYYWREGEPKVPNMEMRVVLSGESSATEAKTAAYDVVLGANTREFEGIEAADGVHMEYGMTANTVYILLNTAKAPMDNVKVREAFARAINAAATVQLAYGDFGEVATAMVSPGIGGRNEETFQKYYGTGQDIETAKSLLAEAGHPDGIDLEITVEANDTQRCDMAEAMQAQVLEAGINLTVNKMESAPMREYLARGDHQICIYGFTSNTMEADGFLSQLQPGSSALARIGYDNQEFFDLYTEGCATEDTAARDQIWEQCLEMLMEDYTMIPLWHKELGAAVKDNVEGFWWAKDYEQCYFQFVSKS